MLVNSWSFQENTGKLMMIYQKHIHVTERELYESNLSVNSFFPQETVFAMLIETTGEFILYN